MVEHARLYNIRNQKVLHVSRMEIVKYALSHPIKATARDMGVSITTVRKWLRRYEEDPHAPLYDRRPETTNHPAKMAGRRRWRLLARASGKSGYRMHLVNTVREKRERGERVIVSILKKQLGLPYSPKTLIKVLRAERLWKQTKPTPKPKRDMRHVTDNMKFGQSIQVGWSCLRHCSPMRPGY